jgi:ribosomal protein S27AE
MTMLVETAVERYRFVCGRCGHTWTADYDVQYVSDDVGATFAFYRLDGVPVPASTNGDIPCPNCGAMGVAVIPEGRRDSPPRGWIVTNPVSASRQPRYSAARPFRTYPPSVRGRHRTDDRRPDVV